MTQIIPKVKKNHVKTINFDVFQGYVEVRENNRYIFSKFSGINRLTSEDAKVDAIEMRLNLIDCNHI